MSTTTIKCYYGQQCRRFDINWPEKNKYLFLAKTIQDSFHLPSGTELVLQYVDNDGDSVTFDTDAELVKAFDFAENVIFKIYAHDAQKGNGWTRRLSEQEKLVVRQGINLARDTMGQEREFYLKVASLGFEAYNAWAEGGAGAQP